jgi:hypothetical protein
MASRLRAVSSRVSPLTRAEVEALGRHLFDLALVDLLEALGGVEDEIDVFGGHLLDAENVFMLESHAVPPVR